MSKPKIKNTKDTTGQRSKCLIYGDSGSGKTTLAGTLPSKTLIISAEAGLLSLAGKDIDYINLNVDDDGVTIKEPNMRLARLGKIFEMLSTDKPVYENVFLDSLTEIAECVISAVQLEFPDRKDSFPMWGEYAKRMRKIVKAFRDLENYNVFMTCLSDIDKDENNKRFVACDVPGKIGKQLPQFFDEVFYIYVTPEGERMLITQKTETLVCKDRSGKLDARMPADLGAVMLKMFERPQIKKGEK